MDKQVIWTSHISFLLIIPNSSRSVGLLWPSWLWTIEKSQYSLRLIHISLLLTISSSSWGLTFILSPYFLSAASNALKVSKFRPLVFWSSGMRTEEDLNILEYTWICRPCLWSYEFVFWFHNLDGDVVKYMALLTPKWLKCLDWVDEKSHIKLRRPKEYCESHDSKGLK